MGLHLGGRQSMGGHSLVETQSMEVKVLVANEAGAAGGRLDVSETRSSRSRNAPLVPGHFSALSAAPAAIFLPCLLAPPTRLLPTWEWHVPELTAGCTPTRAE